MVEAMSARLRVEVDLEALPPELLAVVDQGKSPKGSRQTLPAADDS